MLQATLISPPEHPAEFLKMRAGGAHFTLLRLIESGLANSGRIIVKCLFLLALSLLMLPELNAQQSLTLSEAVSAAFASHPLLAAAQSRADSARGLRRQAALRPNTQLILQSENVRSGSQASPFVYWRDTDSFAYLQQTFETAGKRGHRIGVADQGIRRAELETEVLRRQIALRVKHAYWAAAGAQLLFTLLQRNEKTFQQIVDYHEVRVKEGAMAEADLIRVRLEADRIKLAATQAGLDAARARIALLREMGRSDFPETQFPDPLELKDDRLLLADAERAILERPEIALARVQMEEARAALGLQQSLARPNYDAYAGYKRTTGLNAMIVGLTFELPWLNRNQGNIESVAARTREAESNLAATQALVRAEVAAAAADYETRRRQVRDFLSRFRDQANETSRIAQAAYRLGGADLLRLLDAERLRIDVEMLAIRALAEYRQSIVALENAMGVQP